MVCLAVRIQGTCRIRDDPSRVYEIFVRYAPTLNPIPCSEEGQTQLRIAFSLGEIVTERVKGSRFTYNMMYEKLLGTEKYLRYGWKRKHWQTWISALLYEHASDGRQRCLTA